LSRSPNRDYMGTARMGAAAGQVLRWLFQFTVTLNGSEAMPLDSLDVDDCLCKSCGASRGRLCPTPPVMVRFAYLPEFNPHWGVGSGKDHLELLRRVGACFWPSVHRWKVPHPGHRRGLECGVRELCGPHQRVDQ
jgi:hypothetical protein